MASDRQRLQEIGHLLRTQDNRITDAPIFVVEQKIRDYGYDSDHSFDGYEWVNPGNDHETAEPKKAKRLDALAEGLRDTGPWEKIYYKDRWEFVTACFTEQGCLDYLKINGHNLRETRIYAHGSYRNQEYRDVREHLLGLPEPGKESCGYEYVPDEVRRDLYRSECNPRFVTAKDELAKYCSRCGKPIQIKEAADGR